MTSKHKLSSFWSKVLEQHIINLTITVLSWMLIDLYFRLVGLSVLVGTVALDEEEDCQVMTEVGYPQKSQLPRTVNDEVI